jgi:hypothetical protein
MRTLSTPHCFSFTLTQLNLLGRLPMASKQTIYRKTPKGKDAIANRQSGLAPKLRSLLILVDGKRGDAELAELVMAAGDGEQLLSQLARDGLIEPAGGAALPAAPVPVVPVPAAPVAAVPVAVVPEVSAARPAATEPAALEPPVALTLSEAKRLASRLLIEMLGPTSDVLCMKIESAGNLADFVSAVKRAKDIVRDIKSVPAAERFIAQVERHMPQA